MAAKETPAKFDAFGTAFNIIGFGLSYIYSRNKRRAAKRARLRSAGTVIQPSLSGQPLFIPYGRCRLEAAQINVVSGNSIRDSISDPTTYTLPSDNTFGTLANKTGSNDNDFLLRAFVLCPAEIEEIRDLRIGDLRFDDASFRNTCWAQYGGNGVAFDVATNFEKTVVGVDKKFKNTDLFTRVVGLITLQKLDLILNQWNGEELISAHVDGLKVPNVVGGAITAKSFSDNAVRVLLDFMTNSFYGFGMSSDQFDLASYETAIGVGDKVAVGPGNTEWNLPFPTSLQNLYGLNHINTYGAYFNNVGFSAIGDTGTVSFIPTITKYTFNGALNAQDDLLDNYSNILECIPGALRGTRRDGKEYLSVVDYVSNDPNTYLTDPDFQITPNMIVRGSTVSKKLPGLEDRPTQITAKFRSVNEDYAESSITYPKTGSAAFNNVLASNGGQRNDITNYLEGVNNPYSANNIAAYAVNAKDRYLYTFTMTIIGRKIEVGDIVPFVEDATDPDRTIIIRILDKRPTDASFLQYQITAVDFVPEDYAFIPGDKEGITEYLDVDLGMLPPINVSALPDTDRSENIITWTKNPNQVKPTAFFLIQKLDPDKQPTDE